MPDSFIAIGPGHATGLPGLPKLASYLGHVAMAEVGFHASHELCAPDELLRLLAMAERAGFTLGMCSDHFHPWSPSDQCCGNSFSWLGAALQATRLTLGTICCPLYRYHPAVIAQIAATCAVMFPDRFWIAFGTGEALNEVVALKNWPEKAERQRKLQAAAACIRQLWAGKTVADEPFAGIGFAQLSLRPAHAPLLLAAATTAETAAWAASWADGLLTASAEPNALAEVIAAFRANGGSGRPIFAQAAVSYDRDEERAWEFARRNWSIAALPAPALQDLRTPQAFAVATAGITVEDLRGKLRASSDLGQHRAWIEGDFEQGVDAVFLHHVGPDIKRFIDAFAESVLPAVSGRRTFT